MKLNYTITLVLLVIFNATNAQTVSVNKINERRSTSDGSFDNRCEIEFKVSGDEARKYKFVKISKITTIKDDQGIELMKENNFLKYEAIDNEAKVKIETKIPSRKSMVLKEIIGELILYNPTVDNGAIISVTDYEKRTNVNLVPNGVGFQLIYLTKTSAEQFVKEQQQKKTDEIKKLPEPARKMAEEIIKAFDSFSSISDNPNELTFLIQGDESKFVDLCFEDENGKKIQRNGFSGFGNLITYSFREKPKSNWKLLLNIESDKSIKKIPFSLTNIELP
jgi:hypothetical protein